MTLFHTVAFCGHLWQCFKKMANLVHKSNVCSFWLETLCQGQKNSEANFCFPRHNVFQPKGYIFLGFHPLTFHTPLHFNGFCFILYLQILHNLLCGGREAKKKLWKEMAKKWAEHLTCVGGVESAKEWVAHIQKSAVILPSTSHIMFSSGWKVLWQKGVKLQPALLGWGNYLAVTSCNVFFLTSVTYVQCFDSPSN